MLLPRLLTRSLHTLFTSLLPLFVLSHFSHHVITAIAAPLLPLIRSSFSLSYTQSGLLLSAFTLTYGIGHLPSGWLTDRIGGAVMIFIGIAGVAVAGFFFGLAPSIALLFLANTLIGVCASCYHPAASSLIARLVKPEQRGSALGVHVIGGSASYFLAPLLAGAVAAALGWRGTYIALSIPTLALGLILFFLLKRATVKRGIAHKAWDNDREDKRPVRFWVWMVAFLALTTLSGAMVGSLIGFIPLLLVDSFGIREETAAGLQAIIFSGGFWAAPLAGFLSDRVGKIPLLFGACAMAVPTIFLLPRVPFGIGLYVLFILLGLFMFIRMPVSESLIIDKTPIRLRSAVLGVYFLGSSVGGGAFTPLVGWLSDNYGFRRSFTVNAAIILGLIVVCAVVLALSREPKQTAAE